MSDEPKRLLVERVAKVVHEAKIKECWGWMGGSNSELWEKANIAVPNQPWHDIAYAQAKAALAACRAEEMRAALRDLLDDTQHRDHDCGDTPENCPVLHARALLAELDGIPSRGAE